MPHKLRLTTVKKYQRNKYDNIKHRPLTVNIPTALLQKVRINNLNELRVKFTRYGLPKGWVESHGSTCGEESSIVSLSTLSLGLEPLAVSVIIDVSLKWSIKCRGLEVLKLKEEIDINDRIESYDTLKQLLIKAKMCSPCMGFSLSDECIAVLQDDEKPACLNEGAGQNTIHAPKCAILCYRLATLSQCEFCERFKKTVLGRKSRRNNKNPSSYRTHPSAPVRYSVLTRSELMARSRLLHEELRKMKKQRDRWCLKAENLINEQSIKLGKRDHEDMVKIITNEDDNPTETNHMSPFQKIFWEQQALAAKKTDHRGMRWHPQMIKYCIYLRHQSPGAYETLRDCLKLPSQRTLRDYTHYVESKPGFSWEVDKQIHAAGNLKTCEERERYAILLIDEMYIKENLVFSKPTGEMIGFCSLGETPSNFDLLEKAEKSTSIPPELLANTVTTLMVRGLFTHLQFPYAYFPSRKPSGFNLFGPLWEAVNRLERIGFRIMGTTADLFLLIESYSDYIIPKGNLYTKLPIHLLQNNGKFIEWKHLKDVYEKMKSRNGLSLVPKIKYEHIQLTSFSKMRVDLAAQVLSESVSKALTLHGGENTTETALFVSMFDKFFDCVNVRNFTDGKNKQKPFQNPYRSAEDFRITWLQKTFIPYLDTWEKRVNERVGYTDAQKERMLLSQPTLDGLRMTCSAFIELVQYLFQVPGVSVFFSRRLCQDPLEKFFGCQRQVGRTNDNPTMKEFQKNTQALRVVNSFCRGLAKSNCRGNDDQREPTETEQSLLPRRNSRKRPRNHQSQLSDPMEHSKDPCSTIIAAAQRLLQDSSFLINPDMKPIIDAAKALINWALPVYPTYMIQYSELLLRSIKSCFKQNKK